MVNRHLPMRDVCASRGLRLGPGAMIHCWHPERYKADDRTPSVSICSLPTGCAASAVEPCGTIEQLMTFLVAHRLTFVP